MKKINYVWIFWNEKRSKCHNDMYKSIFKLYRGLHRESYDWLNFSS